MPIDPDEYERIKAHERALRLWSTLGRRLQTPFRPEILRPAALRTMIRVAGPFLEEQGTRVRSLIKRSSDRLSPFADPLLVDFGAHRWLSRAREEIYSDWLAWIIGQLHDPEPVFELLGIEDHPGVTRARRASLELGREVDLPETDEARAGRFDLVIRYRGAALILLEAKLIPAKYVDADQLRRYRAWLRKQGKSIAPTAHTHAILLTPAAEKAAYQGFRSRSWVDLCISLRRIIASRRLPSRVVEAMTLAFVSAVEQNVLGFSREQVKKAADGERIRLSSRISEYLETCLDEGRPMAHARTRDGR